MADPPLPSLLTTTTHSTHTTGMIVHGNVNAQTLNIHVTSPPTVSSNKFESTLLLKPIELPPTKFTGRKKFLEKIHDHLSQKVHVVEPWERIVVITGLGGIGKSSLAKKYAQNYQTSYQNNVAWINSETEDSIRTSFMSLAEQMKITPIDPKNLPELVSNVYRHFSDQIKTGLFILDNANQFKTVKESVGIQSFLPTQVLPNFPLFLVTSRERTWFEPGLKIITIDLGPLTPEESLTFFNKSFDCCRGGGGVEGTSEKYENVQKSICHLGSLLDGLPLAMNLAAAAICQDLELLGCDEDEVEDLFDEVESTIKNYIHEFKTNGEKWMTSRKDGFDLRDSYHQIMGTVWMTTMTKVRRHPNSQVAIDLLNIIAYLPTDRVSVELCHFISNNIRCTEIALKRFCQSQTVKSCAVRKSFRILEKNSILSVLHDQNSSQPIRIHRLVQKWCREALKLAKNFDYLIQLTRYLENNSWEIFCLSEEYFRDICDHLQNNLWPRASFKQSLYFATMSAAPGPQKEWLGMLNDIHSFLEHMETGELLVDDLEAFSNLSKMMIILCRALKEHEEHEEDNQPIDESMRGLNSVVDNSKLFPPTSTHPLTKVTNVRQLLHWMLDEAFLWRKNCRVQDFVARLVNYVADEILDETELLTRIRDWLPIFFNCSSCEGAHILNFVVDMTSYTATNLVGEDQTFSFLCKMLETRVIVNHEEFDKWYLLQGTLSFANDWPRNASEILSGNENGLGVCQMFLKYKGLDILTHFMLQFQLPPGGELPSKLSKHEEDIEWAEIVFEQMIPMACLEDCAREMTGSVDFMKALANVISIVNDALQLQEDMVAQYFRKGLFLDTLLILWFALLCHPCVNLSPTCHQLTHSVMTSCHQTYSFFETQFMALGQAGQLQDILHAWHSFATDSLYILKSVLRLHADPESKTCQVATMIHTIYTHRMSSLK